MIRFRRPSNTLPARALGVLTLGAIALGCASRGVGPADPEVANEPEGGGGGAPPGHPGSESDGGRLPVAVDGGDAGQDVVDAWQPPPHAFNIGMNEWTGEFAPFQAFRQASGAPSTEPRLCHVYTYWNITQEDPPGGDQTHTLQGLPLWMATASNNCDEVLVTFQGKQSVPESAPSTAAFEAAFLAFRHLTDPGQPLASWNGKLAYTPWNEPNNQNPSGSGLTSPISPEQAAEYYLAIRKHCDKAAGCKVAAGDLATNGGTARDIEWNCANDNDPGNTPTRCAQPSSLNPTGAPPSYLDRYKNYVARNAARFGLPATFRPEYFAFHPWHDVNSYIESNAACGTYQNCVTRRLLTSMGGSWSAVELWDDEIGVGLQTNPAPDKNTQACGAAFLVRLTNLSPRLTRVYFMTFRGGNGPLYDGSTIRPAGSVLANRATTYSGAACAATGL